ncbi:MAG: DUF3429 domain-containing protein [Hyphomonadaceae bacterium]|nr:DUF3429 domain-containing protein [Hyphomonadaceae bacterium]
MTSALEPPASTRARGAPLSAVVLGVLGLAPFVALAAAAQLLGGVWADEARFALVAYGATILSFLGGIHWGFALRDEAARDVLPWRLTVGVIPQLVGWAALLAPTTVGLWVTAGAIMLFVAADGGAVREKLAPAWFLGLRAPLSAGAALCLAAGALA